MMARRRLFRLSCALIPAALVLSANPVQAEPPRERDVAQRVDAAIAKALPTSQPALTDDATFLRRLSIDLTGKLPDPDDVRRFVADTDSEKRIKAVEKLLTSDAYAVNWGRYWRDVLTYHTPASGNYLRWELFDRWMSDQLRRNRPWSDVVTDLVTAVMGP